MDMRNYEDGYIVSDIHIKLFKSVCGSYLIKIYESQDTEIWMPNPKNTIYLIPNLLNTEQI